MSKYRVDDDGLARIGNAYFMVRSAVGDSLHAINPKTKKTYCGRDILKLWDKWRPIDKLPDDKNQPTCKICQRHYDDQIKEDLRNLVKDLKETIEDYLDTRVWLKDAEGLGLFTEMVAKFMQAEKKRIKAKKEVEA